MKEIWCGYINTKKKKKEDFKAEKLMYKEGHNSMRKVYILFKYIYI